MTERTIWTIGHSDRQAEAFVETLASHGVRTLADVRRYPHSRRQPWTNVDELNKTLFRAGIRYTYLGDTLGGYRKSRVDSRHTALAGSSFQAYADHMETPIFAQGYARLVAEAEASPTAFMCAEGNPKKCHRRLIADRLAANGWQVAHIVDAQTARDHQKAPSARIEDGVLVYREIALDDFRTD